MVIKMDNMLNNYLFDCFGATIAESFSRAAVYEPLMDYVEYVTVNATTVSDRVDGYLTLIYAADSRTVVGFRLKGFRAVFNKLKPVLKLRDAQFVSLTQAIEQIVTELGDVIFRDAEVESGYKAAIQLAQNDDVKLSPDLLLAAA